MLVFVEHGTRRMHLGGVTAHPAGDWTVQQARNLAPGLGERFAGFGFLIRDRGPEYHRVLRCRLPGRRHRHRARGRAGPADECDLRAPDWHPRRELPGPTLILNQAHLRAVLADYQEHYTTARPHQGIGQRVPGTEAGPRVTAPDLGTCQIRRKPVLSGLINEHERAA